MHSPSPHAALRSCWSVLLRAREAEVGHRLPAVPQRPSHPGNAQAGFQPLPNPDNHSSFAGSHAARHRARHHTTTNVNSSPALSTSFQQQCGSRNRDTQRRNKADWDVELSWSITVQCTNMQGSEQQSHDASSTCGSEFQLAWPMLPSLTPSPQHPEGTLLTAYRPSLVRRQWRRLALYL